MVVKINEKRLAKIYNEHIDWLLDYKRFGRKVLFMYPSTKETCSNCYVGANGLSSGRYKPGGAFPFQDYTTCPVCKGRGTFDVNKDEEDVLIVLFDTKMWFEPEMAAKLPDNTVMVIGDRAKSWSKVVRSTRAILNRDVYSEGTPYRLHDQPHPVGLFNSNDKSGSKYFFAYYVQEGGA